MSNSNGSGSPLTEQERALLARLKEQRGEEKAAKQIGTSVTTYARAVAGFGLQRGTLTLIRLALAKLPKEAA